MVAEYLEKNYDRVGRRLCRRHGLDPRTHPIFTVFQFVHGAIVVHKLCHKAAVPEATWRDPPRPGQF